MIASFEGDEAKRLSNIEKHGIDFLDAIEIFDHPHLLRRSPRDDEERWAALGEVARRVVVVVFTNRGEAIRLISARKARRYEREQYQSYLRG